MPEERITHDPSQEALTDADIKRIHDTQACLPDLVAMKDQWPEILRFARAVIDADRKARQQDAPMFTAEQVRAAEERARADERRNWSFVKSRIAYQGFCYGMGSQDGIDSLRRAIVKNRHD